MSEPAGKLQSTAMPACAWLRQLDPKCCHGINWHAQSMKELLTQARVQAKQFLWTAELMELDFLKIYVLLGTTGVEYLISNSRLRSLLQSFSPKNTKSICPHSSWFFGCNFKKLTLFGFLPFCQIVNWPISSALTSGETGRQVYLEYDHRNFIFLGNQAKGHLCFEWTRTVRCGKICNGICLGCHYQWMCQDEVEMHKLKIEKEKSPIYYGLQLSVPKSQ